MFQPNSHPARDEINAYVRGLLSPEQAEPLSHHLEACPQCSETVANLEQQQSADTFLGDLRRKRVDPPFAAEPELQQAMAKLRDSSAAALAPKTGGPGATIVDVGLLPLRIGEYELLECLGQGGMGAVFKARHCRLEKLVALKVLSAARLNDAGIVARFLREMRAVGQLKHGNIVAASDAGEHQGRHYLVMELVEGEDLSRKVKREGALPLAEACSLAAQAARGLAYAHDQGTIHRDIKPSNLLLGRNGTVKLLDFGLARLGAGLEESGEGLTSAGQIIGTPDYMAPEQAVNTTAVDARADLYSLGCTLWFLATGHPPYPAGSPLERVFAHREQPIPSLRGELPHAPPELDELLRKLLAKPPEDRPANAQVVADELDRLAALIAATRPPQATGAQPAAEPSAHDTPPMWRNPWLLAGGGAALALLGILLILRTGEGTIEVEISKQAAQEVRISVKQGGEEVSVADEKSGWTIRVRNGKYDLDFKAGGDRFEISPKTIDVFRGDTKRVQVTFKPALAAPQTGEPKHRPADPSARPGDLPPPGDPFAGKPKPLGPGALVHEPTPLPGLKSWSVETIRSRNYPTHAAFRPDGKRVAFYCRNSSIRIVDTESGKLERILFTGHGLGVLAWHPQGRILASLGESNTSGLQLWDAETGALLRDGKASWAGGNHPPCRLAWSLDGSLLAAAFESKSQLRLALLQEDGTLWKETTCDPVATGIPDRPPAGLAWSPDGKRLAVSRHEAPWNPRILGRDELQQEFLLEGELKSPAFELCWSPDGACIAGAIGANGANGKQIRVWNAGTGKQVQAISTETYGDLVWSADSTQLAAVAKVDAEWRVHFWNARSGELIRQGAKIEVPSNMQGVAWSADKRLLAIPGAYETRLYEAANGAVRHALASFRPSTLTPTWSPDGKQLGCGETSGDPAGHHAVHRWDWEGRMLVKELGPGAGANIVWSPDGKTILRTHGPCLFHDAAQGQEVAKVDLPRDVAGPGETAVWSPNGQIIGIPQRSHDAVVLIDFAQRKVKRILPTVARLAAWSPDSKLLATVSSEQRVLIWDADTGKKLRELEPSGDYGQMPAWSPDGKWFAYGQESTLVLDTVDWKTRFEIAAKPRALHWSPDSQRLGIVGAEWVDWSLPDGKPWRRIPMPFTGLGSPAISPSGQLVAMGCDFAGQTWIWESATGKVRGTLVHLGGDEGIAVSAAGHVKFSSPQAEAQVVYVGLTSDGRQITYTPDEFAAKFGWRNDPAKVRLAAPANE